MSVSLANNASVPAASVGAKRLLLRLVLMLGLPLLVLLIVGFVYLKSGRFVETENAYIKADKVPISSEVSGVVAAVSVQENQVVTSGQLLFALDDAPFVLAVTKAEAKLAQVRTDIAAMKASYAEKQAEINLARSQLIFARNDQQRQADLVANNFTSALKFDEAKQAADIAEERIKVLEQDLHRIAEALGGGVAVPVEQHPSYRLAQAEWQQAQLDLARTKVRAVQSGIVSKLPKPGQYMAAGTMAMVLVANGPVWVEANFTEAELTYIHPGQQVTVRVDTYPGLVWPGVVESLSPATGAEFSVIPAQNATGNWVKVSQRVAVRIHLQTDEALPPLRAGLSSLVSIDTEHRRQLFGWSL